MHVSCMGWMTKIVKQYQLSDTKTLEVGSLNVNGSVRKLFAGEYMGVDMCEGPGVDQVCSAHELAFPDESFDTVISTEMLEHDSAFWISMKEMGRVLKPGGHLVISARGNGFPLHEYPEDLFRFMPQSFKYLFDIASCDILRLDEDHPTSPGLLAIGRKRRT